MSFFDYLAGMSAGYDKKVFFANGYGASVVSNDFTYGGRDGLYELAVIKGTNVDDFELVYDTPITNDVLGWLTWEEVEALLKEIEALPPADAPYTEADALALQILNTDTDYLDGAKEV